MQKNILVLLVSIIGIAVLFLFYRSFSHNEKIAYINTATLLYGYEEMKEVREELKNKTSSLKSNLDTLSFELETSVKQYEKERAKLSERERNLTEELLRKKQQEMMQYQDVISQKAVDQERKLTEGVVAKVNLYIKNYGEEHGYDFILGATNTGNILYAPDKVDITEEVLEGLNKQYKSSSK